jgi:hypothetical protein
MRIKFGAKIVIIVEMGDFPKGISRSYNGID